MNPMIRVAVSGGTYVLITKSFRKASPSPLLAYPPAAGDTCHAVQWDT